MWITHHHIAMHTICHKELKINLITLEVMNPPPNQIPSKLNKTMKVELDELRKSWDKVKVIPSGGNPGDW